MAKNSFLTELRRRKVLKSAAIYGAVAWGVTEIIVTALKDNDLELEPGDILVVAQKIVSKAEGQLVRLADVEASADATALAAERPPLESLLL